MADKRIFTDKSELVLIFDGLKGEQSLNLTSDEITRIQFDKHVERKWGFFKKPSEKITIKPSKIPSEIVYTKSKAKEWFEEYKKELTKFASENNVTFYNNL